MSDIPPVGTGVVLIQAALSANDGRSPNREIEECEVFYLGLIESFNTRVLLRVGCDEGGGGGGGGGGGSGCRRIILCILSLNSLTDRDEPRREMSS